MRSAVAAGDVKVETILSDLKAPCGVAVRPDLGGGTYEIFVAERGAGRVVHVDGAKPGAAAAAIEGFPVTPESNSDAPCAPGVQSLYFLDHARLVAAGADEDCWPLLRLYDLTESEEALKADEFKQSHKVLKTREGNDRPELTLCLHDLARTQPNDRVTDRLVAAASRLNGSAQVWFIPVRASTFGEPTGEKTDAIGGVAVGSDGNIVTATQSATTSKLKYRNPIDGRFVLNIDIKLPKIVALAYHPVSRNLYAASLGGSEERGGIFRIDDATEPGKPGATPVKIADAERPMALSFGPDGALYVTTLGSETNGKSESGKLLKITGEL